MQLLTRNEVSVPSAAASSGGPNSTHNPSAAILIGGSGLARAADMLNRARSTEVYISELIDQGVPPGSRYIKAYENAAQLLRNGAAEQLEVSYLPGTGTVSGYGAFGITGAEGISATGVGALAVGVAGAGFAAGYYSGDYVPGMQSFGNAVGGAIYNTFY